MTTRRLVTSAAVASVLALGLAGCIKMDMQLELQPDDTVDGSMVFAVSSALVEMSGQDPQDMVDEMQQGILDSGEEMRTEPYDDGEFIGTTTYFEGESLDLFGNADDEESMKIVREGDEFVVSGVMDMTEAAGGGEELGMTGMMEGMDIRIAVTFPGAVSDHNGTLDGNTVSWEPAAGERLEMSARGSAVAGGGSALPLPLLIGGGVLALLVIGGVLFAVMRNRSAAPAAAAPAYGAAPTGEFTPQPDAAPGAYDAVPPAPPAAPEVPPTPPAPQANTPPPPPAPGGEEKPPTA